MDKSHRLPFSKASTKVYAPFELVYSDVWGPSSVLVVNGARYFILFID